MSSLLSAGFAAVRASIPNLAHGARRLLLLLLACAWPGSRARAEASDEIVHALSWVRDEGADSCIDAAELARSLTVMHGTRFESPAEAELFVEGIVQRDLASQQWRVRLRVLDKRGRELGRRELASKQSDCAALTRPILLMTGLAVSAAEEVVVLPAGITNEIDPGPALLAELDSAPARAPVTPNTPSNPSVSSPASSQQTPRTPTPVASASRARWRRPYAVELWAAGTLARSLFPGMRPGFGIGGRFVSPSRLSLVFAFHQFPGRLIERSIEGNPARASFAGFLAELHACGAAIARPRWEIDTCAGPMLTRSTVDPSDLARPVRQTRVDGGASLAAELRVRIVARLFVLFGGGAGMLFPRKPLTFLDTQGRERELIRPSRYPMTLEFGLGVSL